MVFVSGLVLRFKKKKNVLVTVFQDQVEGRKGKASVFCLQSTL